jgi:hypothetical protein
VTACNGFLQLFSLDKNYFEYSLTSEQLKTEGWQFFQLAGKYDEYPDHITAYRPFCKSIENIKRKQVEKEFSGKGEVKKKKEFNFKKELEAVLPKPQDRVPTNSVPTNPVPTNPVPTNPVPVPPIDTSILSMLSKLAPDKVQEVANNLNNVKTKVETIAEASTPTETKEETKMKEGVPKM